MPVWFVRVRVSVNVSVTVRVRVTASLTAPTTELNEVEKVKVGADIRGRH